MPVRHGHSHSDNSSVRSQYSWQVSQSIWHTTDRPPILNGVVALDRVSHRITGRGQRASILALAAFVRSQRKWHERGVVMPHNLRHRCVVESQNCWQGGFVVQKYLETHDAPAAVLIAKKGDAGMQPMLRQAAPADAEAVAEIFLAATRTRCRPTFPSCTPRTRSGSGFVTSSLQPFAPVRPEGPPRARRSPDETLCCR
jgi:hypothetical protein